MKFKALALVAMFASASPITAAEVQQHTMDNGLNVLLIEAHHVPMVAMQLVMPAGSRFDADGKGGSAMLLASMLTDHTKKADHQAWAAKLDDAAIQLSAGADQDAMSVSLTVLSEALDEGVSAMAEALLMPGWDKKRFDFIKTNAVSGATRAQEDATTHAGLAAAEILFPNHPYGHLVGGSLQSLPAISLGDVKTLYAAQIKPVGATLAVSGDITMPELLKVLNTHLNPWSGKPKQALADIEQAKPTAKMEENITLDKNQVLVQWMRLGLSRHDPLYMDALVLNHMLGGGGFGSRLMEEIREKRGLVYGVYSWFQPLETAGAYTIRLQTRADQAGQAEEVLQQVLQSLANGEISQDELDKSKVNLMGGFAQRMDSNRERAGLLAMMGLYHKPLNYLENWTKSIESVTLASVKLVAALYLQPQLWHRIRVWPAKP